jgi:hypothetical protein
MPWVPPSDEIEATCDACGHHESIWVNPKLYNEPWDHGWHIWDESAWREITASFDDHPGEHVPAMKAKVVDGQVLLCDKCARTLPQFENGAWEC